MERETTMFDKGTKYAGTFRAPPDLLRNVSAVMFAMQRLVDEVGMTALGTHIYDVPKALKRMGQPVENDEGGLTIVVVLSTSHAALHTWPEEAGARFDIDSCREFDPAIVNKVFAEMLGAANIVARDLSDVLHRGVGS